MVLFGHLGITLATVRTFEKAVLRKENNPADYRWILIGSLLPDIIDKPVGHLLLGEALNNGRLYAHTLIFLLLIAALGFYFLRRRKRPEIMLLASCCFVHYVLDSMWRYPETLFWPLYGWGFPVRQGIWLDKVFHRLVSDPFVYVPEIIGFIIIAHLVIRLSGHKKMRLFLKTGRLD